MANCSRMETVFDATRARLLQVGRLLPNPQWTYAAHTHPHWEFIYFLQGCGRVDLPHATLHPQQYHLVIYPPGLPHAEMSDPTDPEQTIYFGVEVDGHPPAGAHLLLPDQHGDLRWLCEHLLSEYNARGLSRLAQTLTSAVLQLVERAWEDVLPVQHDAVDLAVQHLHAHLDAPITLTALAAIAHTSPTHLAHCFRARMGISPLRYLQHLRLEAARRLLLTGDQPIGAIARQVGYADPLYFSRLFSRETGCAPSAYRRRNRARSSIWDATPSIPSAHDRA